jgi:hypothetical protein
VGQVFVQSLERSNPEGHEQTFTATAELTELAILLL